MISRPTRAGLLGLVLLASLLIAPAFAGPRDNPPPLPGWTHPTRYAPDDSPGLHGIELPGAAITRSSPVIADIDGNPANGQEVAVGGSDGTLYVFAANGSLLWSKRVTDCDDSLNGAPAVGKLDGRIPFVVMPYGKANSTCDGGVVAYVGSSGGEAWRFSVRAWNAQNGRAEQQFGVFSSPALADTDGDGLMEVGFGSFDRHIYLLNANGTVRWDYDAADSVWSSPAFVDINGDGRLEMITGADITANDFGGGFRTQDGGYIMAFSTAPVSNPLIPFEPDDTKLRAPVLWRTFFDQAVYSSPAIGDILPEVAGLEAAIGASCNFPYTPGAPKRGNWVKIVSLAENGRVLQTLNAAECVQSSPALGDIDDDGRLEVVTTVGSSLDPTDPLGRVQAWDPENPTPKWTTTPYNPNSRISERPAGNDVDAGDLQSAVIADVDGNGSLEILVANFWSVHILNGRDGAPLTAQSSENDGRPSLFAWGTLKSTPAVGDINNDGVLDVVIGGIHVFNGGKGMLYAWTNLAQFIASPQGLQAAYSTPWPMFRADAVHSGTLIPPSLLSTLGTKAALNVLIAPTGTRSYTTGFTNERGQPVAWTAQVSSQQLSLLLNGQPNRAAGAAGETLVITINPNAANAALPSQLGPGTYAATIIVSSPNLPDYTIPVEVQISENVRELYLPLVRR